MFCREQSHCQFDLKDIIYSRLSPRIMWFSNNSSISIQWCTLVCSWWRLITLTPKVYILSIQSASYKISQNQCCGITEQTWTCTKSCTQQGKKEKKRKEKGEEMWKQMIQMISLIIKPWPGTQLDLMWPQNASSAEIHLLRFQQLSSFIYSDLWLSPKINSVCTPTQIHTRHTTSYFKDVQ